jgi:hypothetical protein
LAWQSCTHSRSHKHKHDKFQQTDTLSFPQQARQ